MWLAGEHGAALTIYSIVEHLPRFAGTVGEVDEALREQTRALRERQQHALHLAEEHGVVQRKAIIDTGHAAQLIVAAAEREQADLLVLGRSGHSQVWGRFMGGTADKIRAPCPLRRADRALSQLPIESAAPLTAPWRMLKKAGQEVQV